MALCLGVLCDNVDTCAWNSSGGRAVDGRQVYVSAQYRSISSSWGRGCMGVVPDRSEFNRKVTRRGGVSVPDCLHVVSDLQADRNMERQHRLLELCHRKGAEKSSLGIF